MVFFWASLPSKNKTNKKQTYQSWVPLIKFSGSAHDVSYLVFGRIRTKIHIQIFEIDFVIEIDLYLTFWPRRGGGGGGRNCFWLLQTLFMWVTGWISFNGKGEDSITECDDARKYLENFFCSKSLDCLPFASECVCWFNLDVLLIYSKENCIIWHLQVFRLYLSSFHQLYRQYWNTGFFKQVHAQFLPIIGRRKIALNL